MIEKIKSELNTKSILMLIVAYLILGIAVLDEMEKNNEYQQQRQEDMKKYITSFNEKKLKFDDLHFNDIADNKYQTCPYISNNICNFSKINKNRYTLVELKARKIKGRATPIYEKIQEIYFDKQFDGTLQVYVGKKYE